MDQWDLQWSKGTFMRGKLVDYNSCVIGTTKVAEPQLLRH